MPVMVRAIAIPAVMAAIGVVWWAGASNRFLSDKTRIQSERGHRVVQHGPYRFVRHPLYASRIVVILGTVLILGSWVALLPAAVVTLLLVIRTLLEDRMLTSELSGYRAYAERVTARLVPGIW